MHDRQASRIQNLGQLLSAASKRGLPPVESWNPPYCGDIGLAIARDGTWSYQGSVIARSGLVKLFASVLRCEDDGRHYLVTPVEKVDVAVADAPFLAVEMQVDGTARAQQLTFRTNVDDVVRCGPDNPLSFAIEEGSGGLKPYVRVRGRLLARLTRALTFDLVGLAEGFDETEGSHTVWSGGTGFQLPGDEPA